MFDAFKGVKKEQPKDEDVEHCHALDRLWSIFLDLRDKTPSGMGLSPIPLADYILYQRHYDNDFLPWEHILVSECDRKFLSTVHKKDGK